MPNATSKELVEFAFKFTKWKCREAFPFADTFVQAETRPASQHYDMRRTLKIISKSNYQPHCTYRRIPLSLFRKHSTEAGDLLIKHFTGK